MPRRLMRWLLPASLALNVFLGVVLASTMPQSRHGPPTPGHLAEEMAADLPPADAEILRSSFADREPALVAAEQNRERKFDRVRAALAAPQLDEATLREAFADIRARHEAMDAAISGAILDAAPRMSVQGRQRLAEWRSRPPR